MPDTITDFTVIRHGQTAENILHILQGQSNTQLDELGRKQAACAAERLKNTTFDLLICSDLDRTRETAAILLQKTRVGKIIYTPALREWNLGELEGLPVSRAREMYPTVFSGHETTGSSIRIRNGESRQDLFERITGFLEETAEKYAGKKILLVTHAGPLRSIFRYIGGAALPHTRFPRVDNVSCTRFQKEGDLWQMICWNDTSHLAMLDTIDSIAP